MAGCAAAVLLAPAGPALAQLSTYDCSRFTTDSAFRSCLDLNRTAREVNTFLLQRERQHCLILIDGARRAAAGGDRTAWNRVPTSCLY